MAINNNIEETKIMNGTLIRDNIPANIEKTGDLCNYAEIKSQPLFNALIRDKLAETVNTFLRTNTIEALVEVKTVVEAIAAEAKDAFDELYAKQMEELGGYNNHYVQIQADYDAAKESTTKTAE
jgi:predicted house-cleaning noncanonical NTP pyrophosphatase (MazG superfamily)